MSIPKNRFIAIIFVLLLIKLWLLTAHYLVAAYAPQDDLLFIQLANHIAAGEWLGEYNQVTLCKGAFYPIFIAVSYWFGIPLMASQQILWWIACLIFVLALLPTLKRNYFALLLFLFLFMIPSTYFYLATGRVFRLNIYSSLAFMTLAFLLGMLLREGFSWKRQVLWALGAGFSLAMFWHTREESVFLVPSILLIFLFHLYSRFNNQNRIKSIVSCICLYCLPALILAASTFWISYQNHLHYGIYATVEGRIPAFNAAYKKLIQVESDKWQRYHPVVKDVRKKNYDVSPAFMELKPYLEGEIGKSWMSLSGTGDLHAAFFIWALRDAAYAAGYYKNGPSTMDFYARIAGEIEEACKDGRLSCNGKAVGQLPAWQPEFNKLLLPKWWGIFQRVVKFDEFSADTSGMLSRGPAKIMMPYETITRETLLTSTRKVLKTIPEYHQHLNIEKIRILNDIGSFYAFTVMPLFLVASACLIFSFLRNVIKRIRFSPYFAVSLATLGGILSITFILSLLSITSYDEIDRALQPAYPLLLLYIVSAFLDISTLRHHTSLPLSEQGMGHEND